MATESSRPRRLAAVCAAGLLAVGPALVAGPAFADTPTVAFSGGSVVGMLVCRSQPSAGQVTIAPESRVLFVNRLGQPATLRVGAQVVAKVGANQAVPVVFHYGPVPVSMAVPCSVGVVEQFESVTVAVSRRREVPRRRARADRESGTRPPIVAARQRERPQPTRP